MLSERNINCKIKGELGTAGHVLLTYKSGGKILTSMTHWIELSKIENVEPEKVFERAEKEYGVQYTTNVKKNYKAMEPVRQEAYIQKEAINMIQNQSPCLRNYQQVQQY